MAKHYVYGVGGLCGGGVANDGFLGVERRLRIGGIGTEGEESEEAGGDRDTAVVGSATVAGATAFEAHGMLGGEGSDIGEVGGREGLQSGGGDGGVFIGNYFSF